MTTLTRTERARLLRQARAIDRQLYPRGDARGPTGAAATRLHDSYYRLLGDYGARLPRVRMSTCPFTGAPYLHSFDPFGLDGPWWYQTRGFAIDEPHPPASFRVLQGALALHGRAPAETDEPVQPGPEAPFVVPRLLRLPGMVAVVAQLDLHNGDTAYPIVYFSPQPIPAASLHQHWRDQELWFRTEEGHAAWTIAYDRWDFDLAPWIAAGKLRWIRPGDADAVVRDHTSGQACPFVGLPGARQPQALAWGEREVLELPGADAPAPAADEGPGAAPAPVRPQMPVVPLAAPALAGHEVEHVVGDYVLAVTYDGAGRLVQAQSRNRRSGYSGHVRVDYAGPTGEFANSYGDDYTWRDGCETGSATFGPFEQSTTERIAFAPWLQQCLVILVGLNA